MTARCLSALVLVAIVCTACYSFRTVDLSKAMVTIEPGDRIRTEAKDGAKREFVVEAVTPPDLIEGNGHSVRVSELVRLERWSLSVLKTGGAVVGSAVLYAGTVVVVTSLVIIALLC